MEIVNTTKFKESQLTQSAQISYKIIGVMPDANERGKPDIFMAKRL